VRSGFTLVEALVALAILAAVGGALAGLQQATLKAQRASDALHSAAAMASSELVLQRVAASAQGGACLTPPPNPDFACEVERTCVPGALGPCSAVALTVRVSRPLGPAYVVRSATFPSLERTP
jgi:prepilin-type N-terminal cleavage/methylation domain-containing protein